jgi:hypothetical protein
VASGKRSLPGLGGRKLEPEVFLAIYKDPENQLFICGLLYLLTFCLDTKSNKKVKTDLISHTHRCLYPASHPFLSHRRTSQIRRACAPEIIEIRNVITIEKLFTFKYFTSFSVSRLFLIFGSARASAD